jgi:hypothetical protein
MKRAGNLWPELVSMPNLLEAARAAARGKRNRPDVARFLLDLEPELLQVRRELIDGSYRPGAYRTFTVLEPKPRMISAAPFRDRVVHHALTRVLEPVFERRFTRDSYACRRGYGTYAALERAKEGCARYPYALKCDVRKYFPSIDHEILKELLARVVKCRRTLDLASAIIDGSNPQEEAAFYFEGDDLYSPFERRRGLPLGNQTSQFFANVYLNPLDHFVARQLRPAGYIRYVDDFILFGGDKRVLAGFLPRIREIAARLRLRIHAGKSRVYRSCDGVSFLGWILFPDRARLAPSNLSRFRRRLRWIERRFAARRMTWPEVVQRVRGWNAHASHGNTWKICGQVYERTIFSLAGRCQTCGAGRFMEQQSQERPRVQPQQEPT